MIDRRYLTKDAYGNEVFDVRAYEDNEQMEILSQMSRSTQDLKRNCMVAHNRGIFSFLKRLRRNPVHTK